MSTETEKIDVWTARIRSSSVLMRDFYQSVEKDDSFGWGGRVQMLCRRAVGRRPSGLFLIGKPGCGKHTAMAFAIDALEESKYSFLFLCGNDLLAGNVGFASIKEKIDVFLDECYGNEEGLCLIIENLEEADCREEFLCFLGMTLAEYKMQADVLPPLFAILISEEEFSLPSILRNQLLLCRMTLPDLEHRRIFLQNRGRDIQHYVALEQIAEQTEGYSYAQLIDLVRNLILIIDSDEDSVITKEKVEDLIQDQRPDPEIGQAGERIADQLEKLINQSEEFLQQLPVLLETIGSRVMESLPSTQSGRNLYSDKILDINPSKEMIQPDREAIEAMPVKQLARDLFGKELYEQILAVNRN